LFEEDVLLSNDFNEPVLCLEVSLFLSFDVTWEPETAEIVRKSVEFEPLTNYDQIRASRSSSSASTIIKSVKRLSESTFTIGFFYVISLKFS
jgi:hypothetical protein